MSYHTVIPPSAEAILEHLGAIAREQVIIDGRTFLLDRPAESDRLAKHPAVRAAFEADQYVPYWADLWPAARMLAKAILRESWTPGTEALEVGCGLGLGGVVALSMGLSVTFSDYDPCALRFAADNARLNGFNDFRTMQIDWRTPPELRVPVILASDLLYDVSIAAPLVGFLKCVLAPGGLCLLTDQNRIPPHHFTDLLNAEGWPFTTKLMRAGEPGGERHKGTLYRITRPQ
jgi:predicted nicotinamide N-methyase